AEFWCARIAQEPCWLGTPWASFENEFLSGSVELSVFPLCSTFLSTSTRARQKNHESGSWSKMAGLHASAAFIGLMDSRFRGCGFLRLLVVRLEVVQLYFEALPF